MRISIESTLLAAPELALGCAGPFGITLNGRQVVDDAEFFRAAAAAVFARENLGTTFVFSVTRLFTTEKQAERFVLLHAGAVPRSGLVTAVCGEAGDQETLYLEDAAIENVGLGEVKGTSVAVQYTIRGGLWTSDVPDEIPGETEEAEDFIVMRRGKVAIANGAVLKAIVFSSPLSASPVVSFNISRPTGGAVIAGTLREDTVTVNGFTVDLDAATPNGDYVLHYTAVE